MLIDAAAWIRGRVLERDVLDGVALVVAEAVEIRTSDGHVPLLCVRGWYGMPLLGRNVG